MENLTKKEKKIMWEVIHEYYLSNNYDDWNRLAIHEEIKNEDFNNLLIKIKDWNKVYTGKYQDE